MKRPLVYYISSHGYGHGTRSADIICGLNRHFPDQPVIAVSNLPTDFLRARIPSPLTEFRAGAFDVGLIQSDSIKGDVDATFAAVRDLYADETALIEQEHAFLETSNAVGIVSDIAAIPICAAKELGLPVVAVSNFSWDWIYAAFNEARWEPYIDRFAASYALADVLLRLPFACPMDAFAHAVDVPLLAEPCAPDRERLAELSGADLSKRWVLISLVQLDWAPAAIRAIEALDDYEFFTVSPLRFPGTRLHCIEREQMSFPQILASCDVVVTKPGFGIVSECIANDKPMIYTDRADFAEYDYLVRDIERYLKNAHISGSAFYSGDLGPALTRLADAAEPLEKMDRNGAQFAARQIMQTLTSA